ncbi:MAG: hypothetical protein WBQ37_01160, partial [Candidatus Competibacter sp.]
LLDSDFAGMMESTDFIWNLKHHPDGCRRSNWLTGCRIRWQISWHDPQSFAHEDTDNPGHLHRG